MEYISSILSVVTLIMIFIFFFARSVENKCKVARTLCILCTALILTDFLQKDYINAMIWNVCALIWLFNWRQLKKPNL